MSVRFLHTADWQLGLRAAFVPGDTGAVVRDARLRAVRRLEELAASTGAEFVVVAGDVFEHHGLRPDTIRKTLDALASVAVPVYLLPGNHDPYTHESIWRSELWRRECPPSVHVLASIDPVLVRPGVVLLPCPLLDKATLTDPTEHLTPSFGPSDAVRIGVAHGGILEILQRLVAEGETPSNALSSALASRARLDYVALGDWHGCLQVNERTWYSGAIEATRFDERQPGQVLLVDIAAPGALPAGTPHRVAPLSWSPETVELDDEQAIVRVRAFVEALPQRSETLVELFLRGTLDAHLRARLDTELAWAADVLRWLRVRDEGLHTDVRDADLDDIATEGWVRAVIDGLRADRSDDALRALRLLYRLHREVSA